MAFHLYPWTWELTTTTGTGDVILSGAVTGWRPFSASFADGDTMRYAIYDGTNFEEGVGTYHAGANSLSRTTVIRSSNSNAAVNWGAGTRQVTCTLSGYDSEQLYSVTKNGYVKRTGDPASGTPTAWAADLAGQLLATATNDSASAGNLGEYKSATAGTTGISVGTSTNICSVSLTAGDWDVQAETVFTPAGAVSNVVCSVSTTSGVLGATGVDGAAYTQNQWGTQTGGGLCLSTRSARISISGTTTVYNVSFAQFTSTMTTSGIIRARRMR